MKKSVPFILCVYILAFFLFQCTPSSEKTEENGYDSLTSEIAIVAEDTVEISASTPDTPNVLFYGNPHFEPDLFLTNRYDSTQLILRSLKIPLARDTNRGVGELKFGSSVIEFRSSQGIQKICRADITTPGFTLKNGITIGMLREQFPSMLNIDPEEIRMNMDKEEVFEHQWYNGSGDLGWVKFVFNKESLVKVIYSDPCIEEWAAP